MCQTIAIDHTDSVSAVVARAKHAAVKFGAASPGQRANTLESMAAEIEAARDSLVATAVAETHFSPEILTAELQRTTEQLRFFGDVLRDGAYLELATDSARGPIAVHRMLVSVGVAAVFGSSNFPFAYGVAGGDAASALAAGCAIVVKEHPSHPRTCRAILAALQTALERSGLDPNTVCTVRGFDAGIELVKSPDVSAVGFTGSTRGGRALYDLAANRQKPIPFYGELGSLNPVIVTIPAAHERPTDVGTLVASSVLQRAGQMCTKPGILFVGEGDEGDNVVRAMASTIDDHAPVRLLNPTVREQFIAGSHDLTAAPGVIIRAGQLTPDLPADGLVFPLLVEANTSDFTDVAQLTEIFGPVSLVLRYANTDEVIRLLHALEPALVGAVHAATDGDADAPQFVQAITPAVGRLVWNGATTGLAVGWATHHGGSYPASTSAHSSVGATALRRWLRPISYQGLPDDLLPDAFRASHAGKLPRRVDGVLHLADHLFGHHKIN